MHISILVPSKEDKFLQVTEEQYKEPVLSYVAHSVSCLSLTGKLPHPTQCLAKSKKSFKIMPSSIHVFIIL